MGYGDKLMAIGDAWKLSRLDPQHRLVAVGNGRRLDPDYPELNWGLDFLATANDLDHGTEVCWVISYGGHRPYHDYRAIRQTLYRRKPWSRLPGFRKNADALGHYIFNLDYRPTPAPIRLTLEEERIAETWAAKPFVAIEPFIKLKAQPSKQWPVARFEAVARELRKDLEVYQIGAPESPPLAGLPQIRPRSFREALAYLRAARMYIGPEGGLHHGAAAMGRRAVVIFGGYTPPLVTGYDFHVNLTGGSTYFCGTVGVLCPHCTTAMNNITAEEVVEHARQCLVLPPGKVRNPYGEPEASGSIRPV